MKKTFALGYSLVINWFISWGLFNFCCTISVTVFRDAICALRGYSNVTVLDMSTYSGIIVSLLFLILPKYLRRFGAKKILVIGALLGGIVYVLTPFSPNAVVLGLLIGLGQLFGGMYCSISTMMMVSKWFPRKKGTVMGIITAAGILSSGVMLPLFSKAYLAFGITNAMIIFGFVLIAYGVVSIFWLKETPQEVGLMPDNMPMSEEEQQAMVAAANAKSTWSYRQLLKCPKFWCVSLGWGFQLIGLATLAGVVVGAMMGFGLPYETVITVASIMGYLTVISSVGSGLMDTKFGVMKTNILIVGLEIIGLLVLGIGGSKLSVPVLIIMWILVNGTAGAPNNLFSSQVLNMFGAKGYGTAYILFSAFLSMKNIALWIAGRSLAATGGYQLALLIGGIIMAVGLVLIIIAGGKKLPDPIEKVKA